MTNRSDNIYNVNIKRLALLTLPTWLRRPLVGALLYAAVAPLSRLLVELRTFRKETSYRLGNSGQVCRLRGVLNDVFDPGQRRITIEDSDSLSNTETRTVWMREQGRWIMLPRREDGSTRIYRDGAGGIGGYDVWINVPSELNNRETETRLRAVVNMYKLASKRYALNYK